MEDTLHLNMVDSTSVAAKRLLSMSLRFGQGESGADKVVASTKTQPMVHVKQVIVEAYYNATELVESLQLH